MLGSLLQFGDNIPILVKVILFVKVILNAVSPCYLHEEEEIIEFSVPSFEPP
jgi:hypothetical protein